MQVRRLAAPLIPRNPQPDPAQVADALGRYRAHQGRREFRGPAVRLPGHPAGALFELCDAIFCADHAVTSLMQMSLVPESRPGARQSREVSL